MSVTNERVFYKINNARNALGPGVYDVEKSGKFIALTPKSTLKWEKVKTQRFITPLPESKIGPGSYNLNKVDKNIFSPRFAR